MTLTNTVLTNLPKKSQSTLAFFKIRLIVKEAYILNLVLIFCLTLVIFLNNCMQILAIITILAKYTK